MAAGRDVTHTAKSERSADPWQVQACCADRRDGDEDSDSAGIFSRYVRDSVNDPRSTAFAAQVSPLPASPVNAFLCTLPLLRAKGCQS
jgi:hypothetical protein